MKKSILKFLVLLSTQLSASPSITHLTQQAEQLNLGHHNQWYRLLYYKSNLFGMKYSLVDSDDFFLTEDGKSSPDKELMASIKLFTESYQQNLEESKNPACRFPARFYWLKDQLKIDDQTWPHPKCPQLDDWLKMIGGERLSMVFSSYFINNPASMMGHTFLRVHRSTDEMKSSPLLDHAVSFAANQTTSNPLIYPILGIVGAFPGTFSLSKYYLKVQEYNNNESRDLWEYELNLNPLQIRRILHSVWELGPHKIDYFYFDENCALVLLYLLEIGFFDKEFTDPYFMFSNPSDSVRTIAKQKDLVRTIRYRPSAYRVYLSHFEGLNENEQKQLKIFIDAYLKNVDLPAHQMSQQSYKKILDALIAYLDFETVAKEPELVEQKKTYRLKLLKERAMLGVSEVINVETPKDDQPDLGHSTSKVGLYYTKKTKSEGALVEWQPTLHDIAASSLGYSKDLAIQMGRSRLYYDGQEKRMFLDQFSFVEILSLGRTKAHLPGFAWALDIETLRTDQCHEFKARCYNTYGKIGFGYASELFSRLDLWGMPTLAVGSDGDIHHHKYVEAGLKLGLRWTVIVNKLFFVVHQENFARIRPEKNFQHTTTSTINYAMKDQFEWRVTYEKIDQQQQGLVGFNVYY